MTPGEGSVEGPTESTTVGALLQRAARQAPSADAIVLPDRRATYSQLYERVEERARSLLAFGLTPGERVGLLCQNSLAFVEFFFAIASVGGVAVPLNPRFAPRELAYAIEHAKLSGVLASGYGWRDASEPAQVLATSLNFSLAGRGGSQLGVGATPRFAVIVDAPATEGALDDDAFTAMGAGVDDEVLAARQRAIPTQSNVAMLYTSGTTSRPKAAMHTHESLVRGSMARVERLDRGAEERTWCPTPLFHVNALAVMLGAVGFSDAFVTMARLDAAVALEMLADERVTTAWPAFPAVIHALLEHPASDELDLTNVRQAAMVLDPAAIEATEAVFPNAKVFGGYGLTEAVGMAAMCAPGDSRVDRVTTCGRPFPGMEIVVVDAERRPLAPGETGEIALRGHGLFSGYFDDDETTSHVVDGQGWFYTGDLGFLREDGRLVFQGRLKDMLKVGGENVAAMEVETVLLEHPDVRVAAVVGMPDRRLDEVPVAFVELKTPNGATEQDLIDHCAERLARYKVPRVVRFVAEDGWPMSETKVDKGTLRSLVLPSPAEAD